MKKLIWASLDDYLPPESGFQHVGRNIANHTFFQALLRYGHFEEYHFFLANNAHRRMFEEGHRSFLEKIGAASKVKLFDRLELPFRLRECDYTVFHQSDHITLFNSLCHIRNQAGNFPVTAFIHSLSYQHFMSKYLEMIMGGAVTGDTLICSSSCGKKVLENCFRQISSQLNLDSPSFGMEVIPLGIEDGAFSTPERSLCRKQLGLETDESIGLCFGRFSDYDKMDLFPLLQAFQRIYGDDHPFRLILAGAIHSESYFKMVELWTKVLGIAEKVTIMTNISEKDKLALYGSADFFISVSDNPQETFGLTLLEAMACGLPLVVSDFDGYKEIVTDSVGRRIKTIWGDFETLAALGPVMDEATYHRYIAQSISIDVKELAKVMLFFFSNPDVCRDMGAAARKRFLRHFDSRVIISRLEELWLRLKSDFQRNPDNSVSDPMAMNVFKCFAHYVTAHLTPDLMIEATDYGKRMLSSGMEYPLLSEMGNLIDHQEVATILTKMQKPSSVGDVLGAHQGEAWTRRYLLLWMLKHGLLEVVGNIGTRKNK